MSRWNLAWLVGLPAAVMMGVAVTASAPPPARDYQLVRSLVDVLAEVDRHYVRELSDADKQKLVEDMINGGLERLDPHSQYFNEQQLQQFETSSEGQFGGVGVVLMADPDSKFLRVESPMPGTPAYEAGVQARDLILKVDGKSLENVKSEEARKLIKGEPGTKVTLTVQAEGEPARDVVLTRAVIELHPVLGYARKPDDPAKWDYMIDPESKIALIRLIAFNERSDAELKAAVEEVVAAGARGLILDMRDNPGGLLSQAVAVSDLFLNDGAIVSTRNRDGTTRSWNAKPGGTLFEPAAERPVAVLVNRFSASASEIVAAALQDHKRAAVIGERSYGKGSVQKVFPLSVAGTPTGAVKLTTEVWNTPQGKNIHRWPDSKETDEWGVRPDKGLEVPVSDDERRAYLLHMRGLELVRGKPGSGPAPANPVAPAAIQAPYRDKTVEKALEYLRGKLGRAALAPAFGRAA